MRAEPPPPTKTTFAAELRRLRGEVSLRELARRAACGKSTIHDLEHGRRSPTPHIAAALDRALGAPGTLVKAAEADRQRATSAAAESDLNQGGDVWRREFLVSAGVISAVTAAGLTAGSDIGSRDLMDAHIDLRAVHGRLDNLRGAAAVYNQATDHHQQILGWLATASTRGERQRIVALAADTGGFVGWLAHDLGLTSALAHYREAATHAHQAGDLSCCANLLGQISRIHAEQGDTRRACDVANRALDLAGTRAHPAVRSWLHAVRAHHHAARDDAPAARTDLHTAWKLLDRAEDGETPPYIGYLKPAELHKWTGHTMIQLARATPSALATGKEALDQARTHWPTTSVRGSAEVLTASARLYTAHGDHDTAAHLISRALTIATQTHSARNLRAAMAVQTHGH